MAFKESMGLSAAAKPKGMSISEVKPEMCGYPACRAPAKQELSAEAWPYLSTFPGSAQASLSH
jgi:hypothetical protein